MLEGKRIVLGVTGGIAAYKAVEVCRRLVDAGAHVVPIMTAGAEHFIGRTTLCALASRAGADRAVGQPDHADPAHPDRPGRRPDPRRAGHGPPARCLPHGLVDRSAHEHADRHPGARRRVPGDAHRDVGAPQRGRERRRRCEIAACTSSSPSRAGWPAATSAPAVSPTSRTIVAAVERVLGPARPRGSHGGGVGRRHP